MDEYEAQAIDFLKKCNAELEIKFLYIGRNEKWDDKDDREIYEFTITTPRGKYSSKFYDSIHNLQRKKLLKKYIDKSLEYGYSYKEVAQFKKEIPTLYPNSYSILACLDGYDIGTFEDFCSCYGYDTDSRKALETYLEYQKQYDGLRRIFTPEQLKMLNEIC